MRIQRLEIAGFKSFADRTVLHFSDRITGILGPNGCGKSNIVDALRWAMGEQSAKHLRGGGMEDVIFAGSESRGAMGVAEVTITFKNDGDALVAPEYKGLAEISVTRRLFRDGQSDYLINRQKVRLKDVVDLFLGTGIGTKSYSIIEQGRIGLVVTAKPEDRRSLLEDAAGISKYKLRRKQAERKLEAAEQNLLRVSDIVGELSRRIANLERQAKKAEKYKRLKAELRELDLRSASHRHLELSALLFHEHGRIEWAEGQTIEDEQGVVAEERQIRAELEALEAERAALGDKQARLYEVEQAIAVGKKNVEHLERELAGIEARREEAIRERAAIAEQLGAAEAEQREALRAAQDFDSVGREDRDRLAEDERRLRTIDEAVAAGERAAERARAAGVECLTAVAEHENNVKNLTGKREAAIAREERLSAEKKAAKVEVDKLEKELDKARRRLDEHRQLRLVLSDEREAAEIRLEQLQLRYLDQGAALMRQREELMDRRSRLSSLSEIQKNYEGCQAGVRSVMKHVKEDQSFYRKVHGLVADVLSAEPRYETAIEAILGDRLQSVIVGDQREGLSSIDYLRAHQEGRSSFIPLDVRTDHVSWAPRRASRLPSLAGGSAAPGLDATGPSENGSDVPPSAEAERIAASARAERGPRRDDVGPTGAFSALPVPEAVLDEEDLWPDLGAPGVCGKMAELVKAQPGYEQVAYVLLGDVVVVEDLPQALDLWRSNGHRKTLVTLRGDVLDPVGVITGGSHQGNATGMLAKKREIKELEGVVAELETKLKVEEARHAKLAAEIAELEGSLKGLSEKGHKEELSLVGLEAELRGLEEAASRAHERHEVIAQQIEATAREIAEIDLEAAASQSRAEVLRGRRAEIEAEALAAEQAVKDRRAERVELAERVTALKVHLATADEQRLGSEKLVARLNVRIAELKERSQKLTLNIEGSAEDAELLRRTLAHSKDEGSSLTGDVEARRAELDELARQLDSRGKAVRAREDATRTRRQALDETKEVMRRARIRQRELELALEALSQQIEERYQLRLGDVVSSYHQAPLETLEDREQQKALRGRIEGMGEINLTAIQEYDEVKERHDFLAGQKADLDRAIAGLRAAIKKINRTSRDRYLETFQLVNERFQMVFPRLFGGGLARLELTDPSDPLESGVEMLVQPPGKKLQSVSLMSGGEKALTAIALIFSIFLIKPTPFCLLDEVDAPLDDANVGRYNELVRDMSSLSQFILITHNKRTMEIPDRLYGITMEEPGISKLVGVDLKAVELKVAS